MGRALLRDALGWGAILWLIGYGLGIVFFFLVPPAVIGWVVMPVGVLVTLWVLIEKVKGPSFGRFAVVAVAWTALAVILDYLFIVKLFKTGGGYYKTDVYLYYASTLLLPLAVGLLKTRHQAAQSQ